MNFKEFDAQMRTFEESLDICAPSNTYLVARLDGHGFSHLTKRLKYEKPFDPRFHDFMSSVLLQIMTHSNFHIIYGYTQSDEISLLFAPDEQSYGRKTRKFNSLLAGFASATATTYLHTMRNTNEIIQFDCRLIPLPTVDAVCDYFLWRKEDAERNALNGYCYWMLRLKDHRSARWAASTMDKQSIAWKHKLLRERFGVDFNEVAAWERYGVAMYFTNVPVDGYNPLTEEHTTCIRKRITLLEDFGTDDNYRHLIRTLFQ